MIQDLFFAGHVDMSIMTSTYLYEFFKNGFNSHIQNNILKQKYPHRFILCGSFDPRAEQKGLDEFRQMIEEYPIQGLKLYTAEWRMGSRGWSLKSPWAYKHFEACMELGIKNIHVHKGPTIYPLDRDAFDVSDVDQVATDFPELNFIVEHVGLPRLEDFCWIATQEKNVYAGLAVATAFVHSRPRYFAEMMANLLFWLDEDRPAFLERLRHLVAEVDYRRILVVRDPRGYQAGIWCGFDSAGQAQDLGRERGPPLRDRHCRPTGKTESGSDRRQTNQRLGPLMPRSEDAASPESMSCVPTCVLQLVKQVAEHTAASAWNLYPQCSM